MTDTTDIKALRELLSHEGLESDYHVGVTVTTLRLLLSKVDQLEAEHHRAACSEEEMHKALHREKAVERKLLASREDNAHLEIRLCDAEETLIAANDLLEVAEKERNDLKSAHGNMVTRCALLRQRTDLPVDRIPAYNALVKSQEETAELRGKLANPVVLPERKRAAFYVDEEFSNKDLAAIYNCAILELKKRIQAAGFTTVREG